MAEQDVPALEARFVRLKESVARQLTAFTPIGVAVEAHASNKARERRQAALAALGSAALALVAKDPELGARLLRKTAAGDRERVKALLADESPAAPAKKTKKRKKKPRKQGDTPAAGADDPSTWTAAALRRYVVEHRPRNRTELRKKHGAVYRQLREAHPALLEELLPRRARKSG